MGKRAKSNGCTPINGGKLKELLGRLGLTHERLQKVIGLSHKKSIENWCSGRSSPRYENARELSQALLQEGAAQNDLKAIGLPVSKSSTVDGPAVSQEQIDTTLQCIDKMVRTVPSLDKFLNVDTHLQHLRNELTILEEIGDPEGMAKLLKMQIKNLCILAEEYYTHKFLGDLKNGRFLYACSSLIDVGVQAYIDDPGWMMLLRRMGNVAKIPNTLVTRAFFLKKESLSAADIVIVASIIAAHLEQNISVGIVNQDELRAELLLKRNMACIDGRVLLHATDQVQWDLDFSDDLRVVSDAAEKHERMSR